jgi:hypothetical protein
MSVDEPAAELGFRFGLQKKTKATKSRTMRERSLFVPGFGCVLEVIRSIE